MMEYKGSYFSLITLVIKKPMIRQYGKEQTKKWLKGAKAVYKQMLAETEDIGADGRQCLFRIRFYGDLESGRRRDQGGGF